MEVDLLKNLLALQKLAAEDDGLILRPKYKERSRIPGMLARTVTTPLVGLSGAAAGGIGLGLGGLLAGGYLGHHFSPESIVSPNNSANWSGLQGVIQRALSNAGATTVNALGGPAKLVGMTGGAATGMGLGGLAGLVGGGLGGSYLGWRAGGGGKPKELDHFVVDRNSNNEDS